MQHEDLAQQEMSGHIYANIPNFLDVLFPVPLAERLDVLRRLQDKGLWEAESSARVDVGKWSNLPKSTSSERDLYQPFVDIANSVSECAGPVATGGDERILDWLNCHAHAPESLFENDSKGIPDTIVRLTRCEPIGGNEYRRVESFETLTWRQPVILGEFKAFKKDRSAILQLLRYTRATYIHQPDRRFLYGFTFILKYLQVWYFDRAGGLGSCLIDVHEVRLRFVADCSTADYCYRSPYSSSNSCSVFLANQPHNSALIRLSR